MYDSLRMQSVQTPIIPVVGELIRANPGTISLGQGVAYYGPPPEAGEYLQKFFADPQNHKYKLVQGIPELLEAIEKKLAAENGIRLGSGPADRRDRRGQHGLRQRAARHHRSRRRDHPEPALLLQPRDGDRDGRLPGRLRADGRELPIAARAPSRSAITEPDAGRGHDLAEQSDRAPSTRRTPLRQVNDLCRRRGIYHISDEAYEYFTYDGARHFSPGAIAGSSPAHDLALFAVEGLRLRQLANRLDGHPRAALRCPSARSRTRS